MKKVFLAVLLIGIVAASASNAASYKGKWGFSLADKEHPIGFDFGLGEKAALDLGVGFRTNHVVNPLERGHIAFRTDDIEAFELNLTCQP